VGVAIDDDTVLGVVLDEILTRAALDLEPGICDRNVGVKAPSIVEATSTARVCGTCRKRKSTKTAQPTSRRFNARSGASTAAHCRRIFPIHVTLEPENTVCPCCHGAMHVIGEENSQRLDKIPARYQMIVTHRPKYGWPAKARSSKRRLRSA
jgi:hypothetical protein